MRRMMQAAAVALVLAAAGGTLVSGQASRDALHRPLDELLDLYVRDGLVYYNALRSERGRLDAYIAALDGPRAAGVDSWPHEEQIAFWLNAYNAWVLRAVIDHYPIRGRAANYPPGSIRQIPGVFDRTRRRIAGRSLTLDEIETTVLPAFRDPRLYLALGRGALGSGRLRSEAYVASRLGAQLDAVAKEFASSGRLFDIDESTGVMSVTPIVSWREQEFAAAYAAAAPERYAQRSPVERAILAFVLPNLLPHEIELVEKNQFSVRFQEFDWRLNDLSGRR
ncbi:MAG TPA: DUF547 domain-containing protein [Vicinamibacterales bacterium]